MRVGKGAFDLGEKIVHSFSPLTRFRQYILYIHIARLHGVGDEIVLASTDYNPRQAETRFITAIRGDTITLDRPLEYSNSAGERFSHPLGRKAPALMRRR